MNDDVLLRTCVQVKFQQQMKIRAKEAHEAEKAQAIQLKRSFIFLSSYVCSLNYKQQLLCVETGNKTCKKSIAQIFPARVHSGICSLR
jgi:hypothetical protein